MKSTSRAICILLMAWLALASAYAAEPAKSPGQSSAKLKALTKERAKAKTKAKANAKAKTKIKAKAKAAATNTIRTGSSAASPYKNLMNESSLDEEVAAARKIVTEKANDLPARVRLARASVMLIEWVLRAEAVGDSEKGRRLTLKLTQDLHDTAWRVQQMSQLGDLMAAQAAGFLLGQGVLVKKDPDKACAEFLAAAEMLAPAGWHAAQCLMEASPDKAWMQMERAAQRGHAAAQEWMGRRCLGELGGAQKDYVCARDYLAQSASQGRPRAQTLLAYLLVGGLGGPADLSRALLLYTAAAEKGDANAQNNLGEIHETGRGVSRNPDEAMRWFERAAEQGLGATQFNAGRLWAIGAGQKRDPTKARTLLVQAEAKGISQARQVLDWLDQQAPPVHDDTPALKPATTLGAGDRAKE